VQLSAAERLGRIFIPLFWIIGGLMPPKRD
jgi:hypothetical protein